MIAESMSRLSEVSAPANPYPGLRPFHLEESHLFFGRDGQSEKLIAKLAATRFLAVVGTSGSGKSSLVRAGLLPALLGGMMAGAGSHWRIAMLRPGNDPIGNLARALNEPQVFGSDIAANAAIQTAITEATLRRGNRGLVEAAAQAGMPLNENLLVLVDQFEEIFRFAREARSAGQAQSESFENEAAAFVKLLLEATGERELPLYVVLTMRSDFLGDCAKFWDLPEAINGGQYLIPRLTRDQLRAAITGPVFVAGGEIAPRLVNRLLNDIGDNQDQLPILQHALMRTWDIWQADHAPAEPLDLRHYEASGGMAEALSQHADEAFADLNEEQQRIAEKMFKLLSEKGEDNREIRRPVTLSEINAVAEADAAEVVAVIEKFRQPGRSFLMPAAGTELRAESLIDISHESLIRVWQRLKGWVEEEAKSAQVYKRLDETAMLHQEGKAELWRGADLEQALKWNEQSKPSKAWAQRYSPNFDEAEEFLKESEQARDAGIAEERAQRRKAMRAKWSVALVVLTLIGAIASLGWYSFQKEKQLRRAVYESDMKLAKETFNKGNYSQSMQLLVRYLPTSNSWFNFLDEDLRDSDWRILWQLSHDEKATLEGHTNNVLSVAFAPDGKTLASASWDQTVKLWDVATRQELATLKGHAASVLLVVFAPDGKTLASASQDRTVKLWDVATQQELATLKGHADSVSSAAFTSDGKMLASASDDQTVKLWDVATRQELATLKGHTNWVYSVAFAPDGKTLASASSDATVKLWDVATRRELATLKGHTNWVYSVAFAPDGKTLASASSDATVKLWDVATQQELASLNGHAGSVLLVVFAPDGKTLASASDDQTVKLWDVATRQELATLKGHAGSVWSVVFAPDGKTLASASDDQTVKLWDVATRQELATLKGHADNVWLVVFAPDGKTLASASGDATIKLWDVATRQELATLKGHMNWVYSVAFAPDGKTLASGSWDQTVKLWDVATRRELATLKGHTNWVHSVAFAPDGKMLASASADKTVKLWDVATRQELATLKGHTDRVGAVAFAPDGKTLVSASDDQTVKLWDVATQQEPATLRGHADSVWSVVFAPDGKTLISASADKTVKLWDVATRQELATLKGHADSVGAVAFAHDGKTFASGSWDATVKLWDVATRRELATLKGHTDRVWTLAFAPDGKTLASASADKTIKLYVAVASEAMARQRNR